MIGLAVDGFKSIFSDVVSLGTSSKLEVVAESMVEVEISVPAANQAIWLHNLLGDFGFKPKEPTKRF